MTCTKVGYATIKAARTALNACRKRRSISRKRHERSFYRCEFCSLFHLTSELPNENRYT